MDKGCRFPPLPPIPPVGGVVKKRARRGRPRGGGLCCIRGRGGPAFGGLAAGVVVWGGHGGAPLVEDGADAGLDHAVHHRLPSPLRADRGVGEEGGVGSPSLRGREGGPRPPSPAPSPLP